MNRLGRWGIGVSLLVWVAQACAVYSYPHISDYPTAMNQGAISDYYWTLSDYGPNGVYLPYPMVKVGTYETGTSDSMVNTYDQYTLQSKGDSSTSPTLTFAGTSYPIYCNVPQIMNVANAYTLATARSSTLFNTGSALLNGLPPLNVENQLSMIAVASKGNPNEMAWLANAHGWLPNLPGITDYVAFTPDMALLDALFNDGDVDAGMVALGWGYQSDHSVAPLVAYQVSSEGSVLLDVNGTKSYVPDQANSLLALIRGQYNVNDAIAFMTGAGAYSTAQEQYPFPAPQWLTQGAYFDVTPYCGFRRNLIRWYTPFGGYGLLNNTSGLFVRRDGSVEVPLIHTTAPSVVLQVVDLAHDAVVATINVTGAKQTKAFTLPLGHYRIRIAGPSHLLIQGKIYQVSASLVQVDLKGNQTVQVQYQLMQKAPPDQAVPWVIQSWRHANNPLTLLNLNSGSLSIVRQDQPGFNEFQLENVVPSQQAGVIDVYQYHHLWNSASAHTTGQLTAQSAPAVWLGFPGVPYYHTVLPDDAKATEPNGAGNKPFQVKATFKKNHLTCELRVTDTTMAALYPKSVAQQSYQASLYVTSGHGQWIRVATVAMQWLSQQLQIGSNTWMASAERAPMGAFVPQLLYPIDAAQIEASVWQQGQLSIRAIPLVRFSNARVPYWDGRVYQTTWDLALPNAHEQTSGLGGALGLNNQVGQVAYTYSASFAFANANPENRCLIVTEPVGARL
jgi:hypothetical protein